MKTPTLIVTAKQLITPLSKAKKAVLQKRPFCNETDWWKPKADHKFRGFYKTQRLNVKWFVESKTQSIICPCSSPIFFENQTYTFRLRDFIEIESDLLKFEEWDVFDGDATLSFKTSNNVGWHTLPLPNGLEFKFLVYPTKMDYWSDYNQLFNTIESEYPLWLLTLDGANHDAKRTKQPHERFWLLWLKQFTSLWSQLEIALKHIENQPHNRLLPYTRHLRADRITGKLSPKLEERIARDKKNGNLDSRKYSIQKRSLQVDTPENRYVKFVISRSVQGLSHLDGLINKEASSSQTLTEINEWKKSLRKHQLGALFSKVGNIPKLDGESLVLQQRAGYSDVNRIWGELKHYLDLFGNQAELSLRTIDQLYEVWCLLEVKGQLEGLGFVEDKTEKREANLITKGIKKSLVDDIGAAFKLKHPHAGVIIKLAHEPRFGKGLNNQIKSYTTINKPDIFLEANFPDGRNLIWLFDAKYRIYSSKTYQNPNAKQEEEDVDEAEQALSIIKDLIPPDALNQMHRYRDVLIHEKSNSKTRPVVAAFCLYPGFYSNQYNWAKRSVPSDYNSVLEPDQDFPYADSIHNVGVGAFPLLPGQKDDWLKSYLSEQLLGCDATEAKKENNYLKNFNAWQSDHVLHQNSINIPPKGLYLQAHKEQVLVVWDSENIRLSNNPYSCPNGRTIFHCKNIRYAPALKRLSQCGYIVVIQKLKSTNIGEFKVKIKACYEVDKSRAALMARNLLNESHGVKEDNTSIKEYRTLNIKSTGMEDTNNWKYIELIQKINGRGWFRYVELGDIYS